MSHHLRTFFQSRTHLHLPIRLAQSFLRTEPYTILTKKNMMNNISISTDRTLPPVNGHHVLNGKHQYQYSAGEEKFPITVSSYYLKIRLLSFQILYR
jgi:hypothetical protein